MQTAPELTEQKILSAKLRAGDIPLPNYGDQMFTLTVRFMASNTPMILAEGTHEECLKQARLFVNFTKREHETHQTGYVFTTTISPVKKPDVETCMMVHAKNMKQQYATSRLWMTLELRKKIDKSEWDELPPGNLDNLLSENNNNVGKYYVPEKSL